jgi:hypothetical protein
LPNSEDENPWDKLKVSKNPGADNHRLQKTFKELWRENAHIPGGTAGAIIYEVTTGGLVGGKSHKQKGQDRLRELQKILQKENLNQDDTKKLIEAMEDLKYALTFVEGNI